jgi:hypothetical protein
MKVSQEIDIQALLEKAEDSEYKEAFLVLEKSTHYRIGAGVRLQSSNHPSFFIEVLIYLCPNSSQVDLSLFEKKLNFLKELQGRTYVLMCQPDNSICSEFILSPKNLVTEYETINLIAQKIFS